MRARLRQRLLQAVALLAVVAVGVLVWHRIVRPDPLLISRLADEKLKTIFGPGVEYDDVEIDLVSGVTLRGLRVRAPGEQVPALSARRVEVRHDLLALASGLYRPESIHIEGARIGARETPDGAALAFPFRLDSSDTEGALPRIVLVDCTLIYAAMANSERLQSDTELVLDGVELDVVPEGDGVLGIRGSFSTTGLGQDDVQIRVEGSANPDADQLMLGAVWDPFRLTPELLDRLAEPVAEKVRSQEGESGHLVVSIRRSPDRAMGEIQVSVRYRGKVKVDLSGVPGVEVIDAQSREQLQALLHRADLDLEVTTEGARLAGLVDALGGAEISVRGTFAEKGGELDLTIHIEDLRLGDERMQQALGKAGREILALFDPDGWVDADIRVRKREGQDLEWEVDAILEDVSFRYLGSMGDEGRLHGFPYAVEDTIGAVHVRGDLVWFDDVIGLHGAEATVRVRSPWEERWQGGETGRIRFTDKGPDLRLTVEGRMIPGDEDLWDAVRGSEFYEIEETLWFDGTIDMVEVDITLVPGRDSDAMTEVKLTLDDERFRYARFPLLLSDVTGWVTMTAPFTDETTRATHFDFDVTGLVEDAKVRVHAHYDATEDTGLLHVDGKAVPLAGELSDTVLIAEPTKEGLARVWRFLDPRGRADVSMRVPIEDDPRPLEVVAQFLDASIRLDAENAEDPVEITNLTGTLKALGDRVELIDIRGLLQDASVQIEGVIEGGPEGTWDIHVVTDVIRVTPELVAGLEHLAGGDSLLPTGFELGSGARLALELWLHRAAGEDAEILVDVTARDIDGTLRLPEGTSLAVRGALLEVKGDTVNIVDVSGEAPGVRLDVAEAHVDDDGIRGRMTLHIEEFRPTPEVLDILPEEARDILLEWAEDRLLECDALTVVAAEDGSIRFEGDLSLLAPPDADPGGGPRGRIEVRPLILSPPDREDRRMLRGKAIFTGFDPGEDIPVEGLDGELDITFLVLGDEPSGRGTFRADKVKVFDIRARDITVPFVWQEGVLSAEPVTGTLAEGKLVGKVLIRTRDPMAYEGEMRIEGFRLESLRNDLAPTGPPLSGMGQAQVAFQSRSGETRDLTAKGSISIRDGNLGDLPVAATIFAFMGELLDVPNPPRFERADAEFTLEEEVITLQRFDLAGPLFEMPGRGRVDLAGYVDLVFTPDIIKSFAVPGIMQFPVVGNVVDALLREDWLYAIRLRGDISTAEPEVVFLPPLGLEGGKTFEGTGAPQLPPRRIPRWFR